MIAFFLRRVDRLLPDGLTPDAPESGMDWLRARTLIGAALVGACAVVLLAIRDVAERGLWPWALIYLVMLATLAVPLTMRWTRIGVRACGALTIGVVTAALLVLIAIGRQHYATAYLWLPTLAYGAALLASTRLAAGLFVTVVAFTFVMTGLHATGAIVEPPQAAGARSLSIALDTCGSMLVAIVLAVVGKRSQRQIERKLVEAEQAVRRQEMALAHNAKLAAVGEMAGGIAHEINNPLAIISGRADQLKAMLACQAPDPTAAAAALKSLDGAVARIAKIVTSMRRVARQDPPNEAPQRVELRDVVDDAVGLCGERFRSAGLAVTKDVPDGTFVQARAGEVAQVLLNLLNNAFDAVGGAPGKHVAVRATALPGGRIALEVEDDGPGVPPEARARIFEPFFTTKPVGAGSGLGLPISLAIARAHGGDLRYERRGERSVFSLELPGAP